MNWCFDVSIPWDGSALLGEISKNIGYKTFVGITLLLILVTLDSLIHSVLIINKLIVCALWKSQYWIPTGNFEPEPRFVPLEIQGSNPGYVSNFSLGIWYCKWLSIYSSLQHIVLFDRILLYFTTWWKLVLIQCWYRYYPEDLVSDNHNIPNTFTSIVNENFLL